MNPIRQSGSIPPNFINRSDNTGTAPQAKTELKNKAFASRDRATALLDQGIKARLPKDKIDLFLKARTCNQEAYDTLARIELSAEKLDKEHSENHRQGADIAKQLFDIRKRQFELEPRAEQKMQRQKAVLDEAALLDAHLQKAGSSNDIKGRIREISSYIAQLATDLSEKLRDESYRSTGKEKIELLRSAKKYIDMATRSMQQVGLTGPNLGHYKIMQYNSLAYAGHASDAACDWMEGLWINLIKYHQAHVATMDLEALYKQGLSCMENNDYCLEIHQELYDCCKELLSQTGKCKRSVDEIKRITQSRADAEQRIAMQALDGYFHGKFLFQIRLIPLTDPTNEALEALRVSVEEMNETSSMALGAFDTIRNFDRTNPTLIAQMKAVLPSLIEFSQDMSHRINWLSKTCKSAGVKDESMYREFQRTLDSTLHLERALEKEYENLQAIEQPESSKSRLKSSAPPLPSGQEGLARTKKGGDMGSDSKPSPATDAGPEQCLIDTRFNGKLIGIPRGDKVIVKNKSGKEFEFRRDGEKWVRHVESKIDVEYIRTEEPNRLRGPDPAERARIKISSMVTKAEDEVETLRNEALKYVRLSDYADKNDAPFSQSIGIFNLAMDAYQKARSLVGKRLKQIEQAVTSQPELSVHRDQLQELLGEVENQERTARNEKLNKIKSNPSGPGLNYLMDDGEVTAIRKMITRKKMTGPTVPINKQDFMDEYQADIDGYGTWPPVHAHYLTETAPLKSRTASHITLIVNGTKIRLPVSITLLERLEDASKRD